jgi:HSP20 family protein
MPYGSLFPRDVFAELERLQRDVQDLFGLSPSIRGTARGGFPALNIGSTPASVEVYAFAPGLDPATLDLSLDGCVLTLSGDRKPQAVPGEGVAVHVNERFAGRFRRVINLPDDIDPDAVSAAYRDGVLHVSVRRRASALPRRIEVH